VRILALGAHPDDIEFGCGGSLMRFARAGHEVYLYVASQGEMGGDPVVRKREQEDSAAFIGARKLFWGGYRDCHLPQIAELVSGVEGIIREVMPDYIFVHNNEDTHQDHRFLSSATTSATRYIPNFLFYEGPTTVNFSPNVFIDIDGFVDGKLELLKKHASQVTKANVNMPDVSILEIAESTARFRGIQGRSKAAEAYRSLRLFVDIPENKPHPLPLSQPGEG
jgi:LmbE family N-acetylglucosaminyl deacetylase